MAVGSKYGTTDYRTTKKEKILALWNITSVEKLDLGRVSIPRRNRYILCRGGIPRGERKDAKGAKFGEDILTADLKWRNAQRAERKASSTPPPPPQFGGQVYYHSLGLRSKKQAHLTADLR